MTITLGTAAADPGEIDTGRLAVGETRDGSPARLPVAVINGADDGKRLYLQAVSDGNELNGLGVIRQLVPQLDPDEIAGEICIVAIVNYHGFQVAEHRNPIDDRKLNRTFPGDAEGTASERIADAVFEIAQTADLILDLHQGSTSRMIDEVRVRCGRRHTMHSECLRLAKVFNCGYVLDQKGPEGQLARVAPDEGIPTVDPELGGSVGFDADSIQTGVNGVYNVLRHYEFLDGGPSMERQTRAKRFDQYGASVGGVVDYRTELGSRVDAGDTLFVVTDAFGAVKDEVTADNSGILWRSRRLPQVAVGEYVCSIGTNVDSY